MNLFRVDASINLTIVEREFTLVGVNPALDDFKEMAGQFKEAAHLAAADAGRALATATPAAAPAPANA